MITWRLLPISCMPSSFKFIHSLGYVCFVLIGSFDCFSIGSVPLTFVLLIIGSCICGSGSSGLLCDKTCSQGYWGKNCTIACSCVNGAFCNPINGQCKCENAGGCQCNPGWTGSDCTVPCGNGSWGGSCNNTCLCGPNGVCNQVRGLLQKLNHNDKDVITSAT